MKTSVRKQLPLVIIMTLGFGAHAQLYTPSATVNSSASSSTTDIGIGIAAPLSMLHVDQGAVLFTGNNGPTPTLPAGRRFMWIPEVGAVRFGEISFAGHWDASNNGIYSFAGGYNTRAEMAGGFAYGLGAMAVNDPSASNEACVALGYNTTAMGHISIAMGDGAYASGGGGATAIGAGSRAEGAGSFAAGGSTPGAYGNASIAMGTGAQAYAPYSAALGYFAVGNADYAFAAGREAEASGESSAAYGFLARARGVGSLALSTNGAEASGDYSVAMGYQSNTNSHRGSFCLSDAGLLSTTIYPQNTADNQFMARAMGGYVLHTDELLAPAKALHFTGGNLGVGVASPSEKVEIGGKLKINTINQDNTQTKVLVADNGVVHYRDIATMGGSNTWYKTGTVSPPTGINDNIYKHGNVTIGKDNSSQARLHVYNQCTGQPTLKLTSWPVSSEPISCPAPGDIIYAEGRDNTTGLMTPRFVVNPNGLVGIGLAAPKMSLDIFEGDQLFSGVNNNSIRFHHQYWMPNGAFIISRADNLGNLTGTSMAIGLATGNVGIGGGQHATEKLMVHGNVVPSLNCGFSLGTSALRWRELWACNGTIQTSDARMKSNVQNLDYGLEIIKKLRPVSYTWTDKPEEGRKLGLIAQELKEVISEVVKVGDDENKTHGVMYSDLIPVLINAIKEQQQLIEGQQAQIDALKASAQGASFTTVTAGSVDVKREGAQLFQNVPNPSDQGTTIAYFLPENTGVAHILIFDMNGTQLKKVELSGKGKGEIQIGATEFKSGMYLYSLVADNKEVDTKRMILSR